MKFDIEKNEIAESVEAVHTHTHTGICLKKIKIDNQI